MHQDLDAVVDRIRRLGVASVRFVMQYGSQAEERQTPISEPTEERFQFRMTVTGSMSDRYDIHVFQDLPLHVRKDVISALRTIISPSYRMRLFDILAMLLAPGDTGGDIYPKTHKI